MNESIKEINKRYKTLLKGAQNSKQRIYIIKTTLSDLLDLMEKESEKNENMDKPISEIKINSDLRTSKRLF